MKKRIFAILLLAALLLNAVPAYAAEGPTFRVETVTAEAGGTVDVTIWIDNNPGIASINLQTTFDPKLTLTNVAYNGALGGMSQPPQTLGSPVTLNWLNFMANTNGDMYFAKLTFQVAEDAVAGTYPITISYDPNNVYNIDENNIDFVIVNGGVVIEAEEEEVVVPVTGITLDKDTLSLNEGESAVLTATVAPAEAANKAVTFTSSDPAVATVDAEGKVTAVKAGSATITVTTADGGFTAECVVTVACAHSSKTATAAKEATCDAEGWDAYETCDGCGKLFDAEGKEISQIPFRPATGNHTGGTATCTELAVCAACGASYGTLAEHNYTAEIKSEETLIEAATCTKEAVYLYSCSVCGDVEGNEDLTFKGEKLEHNWVDATCEAPKTCDLCGETEGEALGHKWQDATCEFPKTCSRCLKTEGEARGHNWEDANCERAKICSVCMKTEGEALGHKWVDATCTTAKTCSVCNKTEGEALGHTPDRAEPTENDAVKCTVCGEILKPALGHTHKTEKVEGKDATCTEEGQKAYYVCACGKWFEDSTANVEITDKASVVIEKLAHTWTDATCETPKTCTVCGETEGEALDHKWIDATCETPKTCEVCEETEGEALGHKWVDATCTTAKTCSVCDKTEGEALGHTPDREEPTEDDAVKCTVCGEVLKPALDHTHKTEKVEGKDATCTEDGQKAYYVCACGKWFEDSTANVEITDKASVVIKALGHTWTDATCEAPKTCTVCGETEGEALGHKWVDATCETAETCSVCNKTEGEALGHKWLDATCTAPKTCSVCDKTEGEALGHTPDREEATEDEAVKCTVCGEVLVPALGHTHVTEKVEGKDATCTEDGQKAYYVCKCGKWFEDSTANVEITDKASVVIKALGHTWTEATCEAPKTCTVCGQTEGEKLEHKWVDATCTAPKTCELCGLTEGEALGHGETEQKSDKKGHWDACTVCGEMVSENSYTHVDADGDEKCDDCDHVIVPAGTPQTGDSTIHVLVLAMILSLMGISTLVVLGKKKRV